MRQAPRPPHFFIDHFRHAESIKAPKYTGAGIPPTDDQPLIMMNKSLNNSNVHLKWINKTVVNHTKNPVEQHVYTQCKRFEIWFNASAIIPQQSAWTCSWMFIYCSRLQRAHKHPHFPICSPSLNPLTVPWSCEDQPKPPQYARCAHFACRMSILVLNIQIQEHPHPHRTVSKFVTVFHRPYDEHGSGCDSQRVNEGAEDRYGHVRGEAPAALLGLRTLARPHWLTAVCWGVVGHAAAVVKDLLEKCKHETQKKQLPFLNTVPRAHENIRFGPVSIQYFI